MFAASIGPLTDAAAALATAIGAGMMLGSFGVGCCGLFLGKSRRALQDRVLIDGYYGGIFCAALAVIDLVVRYGW